MTGSCGGEIRDLKDRYTPFWVIGFALVTLADIGTTYICIHHHGYGELNPNTDTSSFWGLLWPELIAWVLGTAAVRWGYLIGRRGVLEASSFGEYRKRLLSPKGMPVAVLFVVPIGMVLGRLVPVVGNTCLLVFGRDADPLDQLLSVLVERYDWSVYGTYVFCMVVLLVPFALLAVWLVYRMGKVGRPDTS